MNIPDTLTFVYRALQSDLDKISVVTKTSDIVAERLGDGHIEIVIQER